MLAIDVTTVVLIGGTVVLCITTVITALAIPSFSPSWRRRNRPSTTILHPSRRGSTIVTPPVRPAFALPPAPGRTRREPDDPEQIDDVDTAWALIERLLESDPGRLVDVLHGWITEELDQLPDDHTRETRTAT